MAITLQVAEGQPLRRFILHYPGDWLLFARLPLVVVLHDEHSTAEEAATELNFARYNSKQDAPLDESGDPLPFHKCVVVYPEAFRPASAAAWNSGHYRDGGALFNQDDIAFLQATVRWVQRHFNDARTEFTSRGSNPLRDFGVAPPDPAEPQIDPDRLFLVGHGSGAAMAYRLLAEAPGDPSWKAAALVNGTAGGLRHARLLLDYDFGPGDADHPRLVRHKPSPYVVPPSLFAIRGGLDEDWASDVAPDLGPYVRLPPQVLNAGGVSQNDLNALVAAGLDLANAQRHARWDLQLWTSINPWAQALGFDGYERSTGAIDLYAPFDPSKKLRVDIEDDVGHDWQDVYTTRILKFFGDLD